MELGHTDCDSVDSHGAGKSSRPDVATDAMSGDFTKRGQEECGKAGATLPLLYDLEGVVCHIGTSLTQVTFRHSTGPFNDMTCHAGSLYILREKTPWRGRAVRFSISNK